MAHRVPDRVHENFTGTSGNITTTGAINGMRTLASQLTADGDTGDFVLAGGTNGAQWEFCRLTRVSATVYSKGTGADFYGSSSGSAITFGAGILEVHSDISGFFTRHLNMVEITVTCAATTDIGAVHGAKVLITGSTGPITSLGTTANQLRFVRFDSTPTLTHNATSLILPGLANIVAAAGDTAIFMSDASGNWRCMSYSAAAVSPIAASATVKGPVELATDAETITGTDTARAVTPANIQARKRTPGTITNDNATAGDVGEFTSASRALGAAVSLSTDAAKTVVNMDLTAGDWDVGGIVFFKPFGASTVLLRTFASISVTDNVDGAIRASQGYAAGTVLDANSTPSVQTVMTRISVASTTTIYLVAVAGFNTSTQSAHGNMWARRVR